MKTSVPPMSDQNNIIDPVVVHERFPIDLANPSSIFSTVQSALKQKNSNALSFLLIFYRIHDFTTQEVTVTFQICLRGSPSIMNLVISLVAFSMEK